MTAFERFRYYRLQTLSSLLGRRLHLLVQFLGVVMKPNRSLECEGRHATLRRS